MTASDAIRVASLSDVGRQRNTNQDSHGEFSDERGRHLLVVADGMGGHQGGETASRVAVEAIAEVFRGGADRDEPSRSLLQRALETANRRVFDAAEHDLELRGMGTTVVALLIDGGQSAWVAHVGDSRAYRMRDGAIELLTADHSVRRRLIEEHGLPEEEAERHPGAHTLERAVGPDTSVAVDVTPVSIAAGDVFLLCSDGLWGLVPESEMAAILAQRGPADSVRALVDEANRRGGHDNITALAVAMPGGAPARETPATGAHARHEPAQVHRPAASRRRGVNWIAVAVAIVLVLGALIALLGSSAPPPTPP